MIPINSNSRSQLTRGTTEGTIASSVNIHTLKYINAIYFGRLLRTFFNFPFRFQLISFVCSDDYIQMVVFTLHTISICIRPNKNQSRETKGQKKQFQQEHTLLYCSLLQIKITPKWLFNTLRGRQCNKRQHIWPVHVIYDYNIIWACLSIVNGICSILRFIRKAKGVKNVAKGNTTFTIFQVRCRHSTKTSGWMNKKTCQQQAKCVWNWGRCVSLWTELMSIQWCDVNEVVGGYWINLLNVNNIVIYWFQCLS